MLTLNFKEWLAYNLFAQSVGRWQSGQSGQIKEEYIEKWTFAHMAEIHRLGYLDSETLKALEAFRATFGLDSSQHFLTLKTTNGVMGSSFTYVPVVQIDKDGALVVSIGDNAIPLKVEQGHDRFGQPCVDIFVPSYRTSSEPVWLPVSAKVLPMKFPASNGEPEVLVDRLVLLVPLTDNRNIMLELPFHPSKEFRRSSDLAKTYMMGNCGQFLNLAGQQLAAVGNTSSGPIVDLNRIFRGRWQSPEVAEFLKKMPIPLVYQSVTLLDKLKYPAFVFEGVNLAAIAAQFGDIQVEVWGTTDGKKNQAKLSEITKVAVNAKSPSCRILSYGGSVPGVLRIIGPNAQDPNHVPVFSVNPAYTFEQDEVQLSLFGQIYKPPTVMPSSVPLLKPAEQQIVKVEATELM